MNFQIKNLIKNHSVMTPTCRKLKQINYDKNRNIKKKHFFSYDFEMIQESANYLLNRCKINPKIGLICGSGLGNYIEK